MDTDSIRLGFTARRGTFEIANSNLKRLFVNSGQLSDKNLFSYMDFVSYDSVFWFTKDEEMQEISNTKC